MLKTVIVYQLGSSMESVVEGRSFIIQDSSRLGSKHKMGVVLL